MKRLYFLSKDMQLFDCTFEIAYKIRKLEIIAFILGLCLLLSICTHVVAVYKINKIFLELSAEKYCK